MEKFDRDELEREYEYLNVLTKRVEIARELLNLYDDHGKTMFSNEWIKKNILKLDE